MQTDALKQKIIAAKTSLGIDKIGFTTAAPFRHLAAGLKTQKAKGYISGFEHQVLAQRLYPQRIFDHPQSIIAIALAYPSKLPFKVPHDRQQPRGRFARASWGLDYHQILRDKMQQLINFIKANIDVKAHFKAMVDTGELIDVAVAQRAGLGFIGRNGLLITQEFGSFVYLGEIITDIPFTPDQPMANQCGTCTRCIDQCPSQALLGNGHLNAQRCLSYQTQTKGIMAAEFRPKIRNVIYGCDICQLVCPFNRGKAVDGHVQMQPQLDEAAPKLKQLLTISNQEFREQFGQLAGAWRGKKPLQRNAIIALANLGDRSAIPLLLKLSEQDVRPIIRATAIWALAKLAKDNKTAIVAFLKQCQQVEKDAQVQHSLQVALKRIRGKELNSHKIS